MLTNNITINSRKFDGTIHRSWKAELVKKDETLLIFVGQFKSEITHPKLGIIRRNTVSYEYYWLERWYNIFRFHEPDGALRNYYCNINMPPTFENNVLDYIDLDIDILVWKDFEYEVLDRDEFEENAKIFKYSDEIKKKVLDNLSKLEKMIRMRNFPFA